MNNIEKYKLLAEGERGLPSTMGIIPNDINFKFAIGNVERSLKLSKDFKVISFEKVEDELSANASKVKVEYLGEVYTLDIDVSEVEGIGLANFEFGNTIDEESLQKAQAQKYFLETSMYFESDVLQSFHLQLKVMNALVLQASLLVDFMSYRLLSPQWLTLTALSPTPPSPDYLYSLHCVYDDDDEKSAIRQYWFHTHGLHRCGTVELEMLNVTQGAEQMHTLVNMTVKKFLSDPSKEKERFTIGYDGMGINLCWLRWEEALTDFPESILGGKNDREIEDGYNAHREPSGVLFAVEDGNMISPEIYATTLAENPIYYITNEETNRMSALAKERFHMFKQVFDTNAPKPEKKSILGRLFGSKKKKEEEEAAWSFLVKLGLIVDDPEVGSEKEHLWYEVLSVNGNTIEGKLLNQPYWIAGLNEGDVKTYPVDLLTDWTIYGPEGTYSTDSIYEIVPTV